MFSTRDYARPDDNTEYQINWCTVCDFGRIEGDFTPHIVDSFYPPAYYTHGRRDGPVSSLGFFERLRLHVAWRADHGTVFHPSELGPSSSVCDIGCGNGDNLRRFKSHGSPLAVGIDPDKGARHSSEGAGIIFNGTAENFPRELNGKQFDTVLMSHVLEHCIDPVLAIKNAKQILTQRGILVIEVPNNASDGFRTFGALWPWSDIPRHLNFFTEPSLSKLLTKCELRILKVHYTGYARQFMPAWISSQKRIWSDTNRQGKAQNFDAAAWWLLFRTLFAPPNRRYDSIRVHAAPF